MNFLCPNHRRQFADLPLEERKDLWLSWMKQACACSEEEQWQRVLSFSGNAFDLACVEGPQGQPGMPIELTLSAILVSRVLYDFSDRAGSERVIHRAIEHLLDTERHASLDGCCEAVEECIAVLMDTSRQAGFFADYLNWSTMAFARRQPAPLQKTLH